MQRRNRANDAGYAKNLLAEIRATTGRPHKAIYL